MGTDIHGVMQAKTESGWKDIPSNYSQDRHYLLFAWIGNVRNGFGFGGVKTHSPITPLTDNRGLPSDFACDGDMHKIDPLEIINAASQKWCTGGAEGDLLEIWMGDHSHSWVTADEVVKSTLPVVRRSGIVTREVYNNWDGSTAPDEWCSSISGRDIIVCDYDDFDINATHIRIEWREDTKQTLGYFVDEMKRLADEYGEVRFVFGFDS